MPEEAFSLPGQTSKFLPPELDEALFSNLDQLMARQERQQLDRTLEEFNRRGILESGQTLRGVVDEVLGPSIERRTGVLLPLAREGAYAGREERLGEVGFERQRQFAGEQFDRQRQFAQEEHLRTLERMSRQADVQRQLLELQDELEGGFGFGDFLGQSAGLFGGALFGGLGGSLGKSLGGAAAGGISSYFSKGK